MSFDTLENYERELGALYDVVCDAEATESIKSALKGGFNYDGEKSENMVNGNNILNAFSKACQLLRANPNVQLVASEITLPSGASTLGQFLVELLNGSKSRNAAAEYAFKQTRPIDGKSVCADAERHFYVALGHDDHGQLQAEDPKVNTIFEDKEGKPVFFKKGLGIQSSISLDRISLDGIGYPPGMIFAVRSSVSANGNQLTPKVEVMSLDDISSVAPMRLSKFALPIHEQTPAFMTAGELERGITPAIRQVDITMTLDELIKYLPGIENASEAFDLQVTEFEEAEANLASLTA